MTYVRRSLVSYQAYVDTAGRTFVEQDDASYVEPVLYDGSSSVVGTSPALVSYVVVSARESERE